MLSRDFRIQKAATAPAEKAEDEVPHELTNIRVQEVSLVDRAANRRKFLITKRDRKAVPADNDVLVVDASEVVDLTKTSKTELPGADLDRADAARAKAEREAAEKADAEAEKKLTSTVKTAPPDEERPAEEPKKDDEKPVEEPKKDDKSDDDTKVEPVEADPDKTPGVVPAEEVAAKADVSKVGRPMRRERLDRVKAAVKALADILGELDVEEPAEKDVKPEKAATPAPAPAVVPPVVDTSKTDAEMKRLSTMVEALQKMVKDQGEQLAKSRQTVDSNTISLERSSNDRDKVCWDADLASPQARLKGRSF